MAKTHHFQLGQWECIVLPDVIDPAADVDRLLPQTPPEERNPLFREYGIDPNALEISTNCLALNTGDSWILIDTGFGKAFNDDTAIYDSMAAAGLQPADFSAVFLTHLHADHYGGLTDVEGNSLFPNATIYIWKDEWDFWTSEETIQAQAQMHPDRETALRRHVIPLAVQAKFVSGEEEILPGIRAVYAPGHTPHHVAYQLESAGERLLVTGDAFLNPVFVTRPEWRFGNDRDHEQACQSRNQLATRAANSGDLVLSFHFAFPGLGHIGQVAPTAADGWHWQPI